MHPFLEPLFPIRRVSLYSGVLVPRLEAWARVRGARRAFLPPQAGWLYSFKNLIEAHLLAPVCAEGVSDIRIWRGIDALGTNADPILALATDDDAMLVFLDAAGIDINSPIADRMDMRRDCIEYQDGIPTRLYPVAGQYDSPDLQRLVYVDPCVNAGEATIARNGQKVGDLLLKRRMKTHDTHLYVRENRVALRFATLAW